MNQQRCFDANLVCRHKLRCCLIRLRYIISWTRNLYHLHAVGRADVVVDIRMGARVCTPSNKYYQNYWIDLLMHLINCSNNFLMIVHIPNSIPFLTFIELVLFWRSLHQVFHWCGGYLNGYFLPMLLNVFCEIDSISISGHPQIYFQSPEE